MAQEAVSTYSYEAYLELEKNPEAKYEFHDGMITAMAGGSPEHSQLASNMGRHLGNALEEASKACSVFNSDAKIRVEKTNRTYYPDASVVCGPLELSQKDNNAITNPILIVEVLSESTLEFDRGAKFAHYRQLSSLRQYVLISQTEAMVDTYYRTEDGTWEIQTLIGLEAEVELKAVEAKLKMKDIYYRVPGIDLSV
jgi:Uma2 family endonuclease